MVKYIPTNVHKISTADSSGRYMQWLVHYKMYVFCKTFISYFNSSVGNKLWSILWVLPRWIGSVFSFKTTDLLKNCFEVFDLLKSFWIQRLYMRKNLLHQELSWIQIILIMNQSTSRRRFTPNVLGFLHIKFHFRPHWCYFSQLFSFIVTIAGKIPRIDTTLQGGHQTCSKLIGTIRRLGRVSYIWWKI